MPLSRKPLLHALDHFRHLCPHNFCPASINPFFYVNFVSCIIQYFYKLFEIANLVFCQICRVYKTFSESSILSPV